MRRPECIPYNPILATIVKTYLMKFSRKGCWSNDIRLADMKLTVTYALTAALVAPYGASA